MPPPARPIDTSAVTHQHRWDSSKEASSVSSKLAGAVKCRAGLVCLQIKCLKPAMCQCLTHLAMEKLFRIQYQFHSLYEGSIPYIILISRCYKICSCLFLIGSNGRKINNCFCLLHCQRQSWCLGWGSKLWKQPVVSTEGEEILR